MTPAVAFATSWFGAPTPFLKSPAVYGPERTPVIAPVAPLVGRLAPRLERQARAVSSLAMRRRVTRGIRGIRVDVVVVPAAAAPLVTLVTRRIRGPRFREGGLGRDSVRRVDGNFLTRFPAWVRSR